MSVEAKHIVVHGDVQGVGFRYFVQRAAARLGLTGNVRNCLDFTVEIVVEGESDRMTDFLDEVQRGPRMARIDRLDIEDIPPGGKYRTFLIEGW